MDDAQTEALRLIGQALQLLGSETAAKPSAEKLLREKMGEAAHQMYKAVVATIEISQALADDKEAYRFWVDLGKDVFAAQWKIIDRYFPVPLMPLPRKGTPAE